MGNFVLKCFNFTKLFRFFVAVLFFWLKGKERREDMDKYVIYPYHGQFRDYALFKNYE